MRDMGRGEGRYLEDERVGKGREGVKEHKKNPKGEVTRLDERGRVEGLGGEGPTVDRSRRESREQQEGQEDQVD
jgi:hypothetical protein